MGKRKMIYKRQEPPGYTKCEPLGYTGELLGYTKLRYQIDWNLQHIQWKYLPIQKIFREPPAYTSEPLGYTRKIAFKN